MGKTRVTGMSILLLILLVMSLIVSACSKARETGAKPSGPAKVKIGPVFNAGGRGEKSSNDGAYAGLEAAKKELGDKIEIKYLEPAGSGENREQLLRLPAQENMI